MGNENQNNQFNNNENNFDDRPAQHYEQAHERGNLIRRMREYHEIMKEGHNIERLTDEEKSKLYSLPKWFIYLIICVLLFFMISASFFDILS